NPYIEPEFTHAVEAGYQKYFKQSVFSTTLYHRVTTNEISRVRTTVGLVSEVRMVNLNSETESGLEATLKLDPAKWWRQTLSGNAYYQQIDGSNFDASFERGAFTYDAKWNSTFLFTKSTSLQANASYRSRNVAPQGVILPMYWLDLSLRKDLWKQKATLTLGLSDVFDTRRFRVETNTVGVIQNWERKRESRILTAGFTYKFGKQFGQQPRKRGHERSDEFGGGGDE
ncbi:MAG TPA: outer membrane beta-barrel family protein, partial [Chitinophagales bacterium]|nr:outer membrane beta-barrel family protein [Chitinophagales bacterium]